MQKQQCAKISNTSGEYELKQISPRNMDEYNKEDKLKQAVKVQDNYS
jgi:hypothetical protein